MRHVLASTVAVGVIVVGCAGFSGGSDSVDESDDADSSEPITTMASSGTDSSVDIDVSVVDTAEVSEPREATDDSFTWAVSYTTWSIELFGAVAVVSTDDPAAACVVVTARADVELAGDHWWSGDYHRPRVELIAGPQRFEPTRLAVCDPAPATLSELRSITEVQVVDGMVVDVVAAFAVPTELLRHPLAIAFDDDDDEDSDGSLFELEELAEVPSQPDSEPTYDRLPPTRANGEIVRTRGEDQHDVAVTGVWSAPAADSTSSARCALVIGTATVITAQNGDVTSGAPDVSLIAGGHHLRPAIGLPCDSSDVSDAGYVELESGYQVGETFDFYAEVVVPDELSGQIDYVVVGEPLDDDIVFFEPVELDVLPPITLTGE